MASNHYSSLASLPLIDHSHVEAAQSNLTSLAHAYAAFQNGKLPTSDQFATMVQKLLKSQVLQPELGSRIPGRVGGGQLSKPGKDVVKRARTVLEALVRLVLEKNPDDKIQRFIHMSSQASVDLKGKVETPDIPLPSSQEVEEAKDSLQTLFSLLITSSELRGILADSVNLFRDLFADAAEQVANAAIETTKASKKAAKAARPTEDERKEGKVSALEKIDIPSGKEIKKKTVRGAEDARDDAVLAARRKVKKVKSYVDEQMPTDAKDAAIERFKAIVNEIQSNPDYEDATSTLLNLVRKYVSVAKSSVSDAAKQTTADADANPEAVSATKLLRQIIESFTGPLDDVFRAADAVIKDLDGDERIKVLLKEADEMLDRAVYDPGYVTSSRAQRRAENVYDRAQELIKSNAAWKRDADALTTELSKALDNAANDKALVKLSDEAERFGLATGKFAKTGWSMLDGGGMWGDLSQVFLPRVLSTLKEIPLPRVEFTSADFDFAIDGVKFTSASFIPDRTHFCNQAEATVQKGYAAYASDVKNSTTISLSGLRLEAADISYYIHKKTGWIGIEDSGLLDIKIGASDIKSATDGLDVTITVDNAKEEDRESFFVVKKVDVSVEGFNIRIHGSQHPIRNWLARPALRTVIEHQFINVLEEQIAEFFRTADRSFYEMSIRSQGAFSAAPDPLAYIRAMLTPHGSATFERSASGLTKVGPKGEYILAIGVEETLLPGKLTGLGTKGKDVVSRKRRLEILAEDGRQELEAVRETAEGIQSELGEEADRLQDEQREQNRIEARSQGWKSDAFDL